jgi:uncharacterized SAM-binding protein YcdF (DUF218 family)
MSLLSRALGALGFIAFIATAFTPLPNIVASRVSVPERLERADAIVVLGASLQRDGTLSSASLRRVVHGIRLHRNGLAPLLLLHGADRRGGRTEADVRAELATELGVARSAILTERDGATTRAEATRTAVVLGDRSVRTILLVSDPYHLRRAQALFEQAGFAVLPAPAADVAASAASASGRLQIATRVLQELAARVYYSVAGYL